VKVDGFVLWCRAHDLPDPMPEWRFAPPRRWRFDYAFVPASVAIEVEGGVWTRGRHTRGAGYVKDLEKYNSAALDGWHVLRFTPQQIARGECLPWIHSALARYWPQQPYRMSERSERA
jgi:very-short-patch-repair endonuclease